MCKTTIKRHNILILCFLFHAFSAMALHHENLTYLPKCLSQSRGALTLKYNGNVFTAAPDHARCYAVATEKVGYLNGANTDYMILDVEITGMHKIGSYFINVPANNKCSIILNHIGFSLKEPSDFFKITVTEARQEGAMILMSGTFEGKLHARDGTEAIIKDGKFTTFSL